MAIKKPIRFLLFIAIFIGVNCLVIPSLSSPNAIAAQSSGFVSSNRKVTLNLINGEVDSFWSNVSSYQNISEFGAGGYVKFANNETHVLSLIACVKTSEWVSIEFDADASDCMQSGHDGWTFYLDEASSSVEAQDGHFVGKRRPDIDTQNDLSIESVFSDDVVFIEVARKFDTADIEGYDIVYENQSLNMVQFASDTDHYGAHTIFYLLTNISKFEGGEAPGDIPLPTDLPTIINYDQLKIDVLGITLIAGFGFIFLHLIRRVILSPIRHDYRLVSTEIPTKMQNHYKVPTFKDRWNETFSAKD